MEADRPPSSKSNPATWCQVSTKARQKAWRKYTELRKGKRHAFQRTTDISQAWLYLMILGACIATSVYGTVYGHLGAIAIIPIDLVGLFIALCEPHPSHMTILYLIRL